MKQTFTINLFGIRCLLPLAVLLMLNLAAIAQNREISGSIKDGNGNPIIGATVVVTGTSLGTSSTTKGAFVMQIPTQSKSITVKFIGYNTMVIPIEKGRAIYSVTLTEDVTAIEELVVIGYGTVNRRDLTGPVSSVRGEELAAVPVANTTSALTGRLAGVHITTTDGDPDADIKIRVRGGGSITQDNSPLYIVDGFPVDRLNDVPASDIESIDVLKDASSTAIYGSRGANGVIIITTKSAKAGRTIVSYNGYAQMKSITKKEDVMNPYEFVLYEYEQRNTRGATEDISNFRKKFGTPDDFDIYKSFNGYDAQQSMFGGDAYAQSHNINIQGGSDKTKFVASMNYINEDGLLVLSGFRRLTASLKLTHQLYKSVKADIGVYYNNTVIDGMGTSGTNGSQIKNAVSYRPVSGKSGINGDPGDIEDDETEIVSGLRDPVELTRQSYKEQTRNSIRFNGAMNWTIVKNLLFRAEYNTQMNRDKTNFYFGPLTNNARDFSGNQPMADIQTIDRPQWRTAETLTYNINKLCKKHDIMVMVGFEATSESLSTLYNRATYFPLNTTPDEAFARMAQGKADNNIITSDITGNIRMASFFGRVNYTFKDRYLLTATLRTDGSTKFAPGKQWGYFPSVAAAWRITEEKFMKPVSWISNLKLRLSFGQAGNNRIANQMYERVYGLYSDEYNYSFQDKSQPYFRPLSSIMYNPDLVWETTTTRNIGLDFGFLKNRISGTIEVYKNTSKDLLLKATIPSWNGYTTQQQNVAQTSNRGIEISLKGIIIQKRDFTLDASFNISMNRSRVDKLNPGQTQDFYRSDWSGDLRETQDFIVQVGQPVGQMYGYVTDGFYGVDDFDDKWFLLPGRANSQNITASFNPFGGASSAIASQPAVGSLRLKKLTPVDPDNPDTWDITMKDRAVIGNAEPKHTGGFNINGRYKGFDFSVFFNWVYGNDIYNANKILYTTYWKYNYYNHSALVDSQNRFRYYNDAGDKITDRDNLRAFNKNATIWNPTMGRPIFHSWAVEDGSFLRLNNLTIGYTLPTAMTQKIHISRCRIYVTGNNLFTWTNYSGFDPEVDTRRSTPLTPGVDYSSYPRARTYTVGLNLTF